MTPPRLLIALAITCSACYPHRGERPHDDPEVTTRLALEACARQDVIGARHLFERLAARHPEHPQASRASSKDPCSDPPTTSDP